MPNTEKKVKEIILEIIEENNLKKIDHNSINQSSKLSEDLGLDSLNLAQLTVMIEEEFNKDIFENKIVRTFGEIMEVLN
tara:strand:+ start:5446 stop:5682 length:237 start_codon:yes stop_codon:yes gene_type:complete